MLNTNTGLFASRSPSDLEACQEDILDFQERGYQCISTCVQITTQLNDCLLSKGSGTYRTQIGDWVVYADRIQSNENSCSEVWTDELSASNTLRALNACSTEFKNSLVTGPGTIANNTDTSCTLASDCDGLTHIQTVGFWTCQSNQCSWFTSDETCDDCDGNTDNDFFNKYKTQLIIGGIVLLGVVVLTKK